MPDLDGALRRIKLSDLRLLQAVIERGGMAKAAAHLNLTQPAVSKAIAGLEHAVGVKLLDRTTKGVAPTVFGESLLFGGVAVFDELKQSLARIADLANPDQGSLRIGCSEAGAAGFVPAVIDRFTARRPRVAIEIVTADPATLIERELPQRAIELAICAVPTRAPQAQVVVKHLFNDRHVIVAARRSRWASARRISLAALGKEPWVLPPAWSEPGRMIADAFREAGVEQPIRAIAAFSIPLCLQLLATGRYIGMLPEVMARLSDHLPLKVLPISFPVIERPVGIVTLKGRSLGPLAQRFMDTAREVAGGIRSAS
jgi:DNA-binding transcriptional LysR family regulator